MESKEIIACSCLHYRHAIVFARLAAKIVVKSSFVNPLFQVIFPWPISVSYRGEACPLSSNERCFLLAS